MRGFKTDSVTPLQGLKSGDDRPDPLEAKRSGGDEPVFSGCQREPFQRLDEGLPGHEEDHEGKTKRTGLTSVALERVCAIMS